MPEWKPPSYKYRKKPVVIEAFQMTKYRRWNNVDWPGWLHRAWNKDPGEGAFWCDEEDPNRIFLGTLEGVLEVTFDDWIILGIKRELYPCKPEIFLATYESAESEQETADA